MIIISAVVHQTSSLFSRKLYENDAIFNNLEANSSNFGLKFSPHFSSYGREVFLNFLISIYLVARGDKLLFLKQPNIIALTLSDKAPKPLPIDFKPFIH